MNNIAAIQMVSSPHRDENLQQAAQLIEQAVEAGAKLLVLPENFAHFGGDESDKLAVKEQPGQGPIQDFLASQAKQHEVWIVGGTVPLATNVDNKVRASCLVFNDQGQQVIRYDKVHLFDVCVGNDVYTESAVVQPGDEIVVLDTPVGRLGLSVCYDLRFPEMYRKMSERGAHIFTVPAAFTSITGAAHWEVLLRARAIENLCYVVAANQGGQHVGGRETYGHSMVIDPWGKILSECEQGTDIAVANIDLSQLEETRGKFPVAEHRKF